MSLGGIVAESERTKLGRRGHGQALLRLVALGCLGRGARVRWLWPWDGAAEGTTRAGIACSWMLAIEISCQSSTAPGP